MAQDYGSKNPKSILYVIDIQNNVCFLIKVYLKKKLF